jgi:hypothetical protein
MNPIEFLKTLYLGDRYCSKIVVNSLKKEIEIYVNIISRIRDESGQWNFYSKEDIENGAIVFTNVSKIYFDQCGIIPNDEIYNINAIETLDGLYEFTIETSNVNEDAKTTDLKIKLIAENIYLINPSNPGVKITE